MNSIVQNEVAFRNRLIKMAKHFDKWARRQGISCYRIYDNDITGYPLAIDRYEQYLHVSEYHRRRSDETPVPDWVNHCMTIISETLNIDRDNIFFKSRRQQKGNEQYMRLDDEKKEIIVHEQGLQFIVNLTDYLDTGLFLDHRTTRAIIRESAKGKRVLNLFAYTGSFTVYAAHGGAISSLTLDMSNTYLSWAQRNMECNGLMSSEHIFQRVDVLEWLLEKPRQQFDIIILDPPTFSNSKMMRSILDVQRDHIALIEACMLRLAPGGSLYFSTNRQHFRLDEAAIPSWVSCKNITNQTLPPDFKNSSPHQCFLIQIR